MPKCIICQGIPTSGKSTWALKQLVIMALQGLPCRIRSCDTIRHLLGNGKYKFDKDKEVEVWETFYKFIATDVLCKNNIIVDNTNLYQSAIDNVIAMLSPDYKIEIKKFPLKLHKAYIRNCTRYFKTGKWIPLKVIKKMHNDYNKINKVMPQKISAEAIEDVAYKNKYVPFKPESKEFLRGKWIKLKRPKNNDTEKLIISLEVIGNILLINGMSADFLLENYTFVDGEPCGEYK